MTNCRCTMNRPTVDILVEKVRDAGRLLLDIALSDDVKVKGDADFVTAADAGVQKLLYSEMKSLFPDTLFVGEEDGSDIYDKDKNCFILDPVDGTTNLMHGYRNSVISLGYYERGVGIYGVVFNPFSDEMFVGELGKGATLNGRPIYSKARTNMKDCLAVVEFCPYYKQFKDSTFEMMKGLYAQVQDIRSIGAAAIGLVSVACGRADIFMSKRLKPWDYAASQVILRECGCSICGFDGKDLPLDGVGHVVASVNGVFDTVKAYAQSWENR